MTQIHDKDGLLCMVTDRIDRDIMDAAPNLKVISTYSVGFEHIDIEEATQRGIYVTYIPGVLTEATADMAFALLLATSRKIVQAHRFVEQGAWKAWSPTMFLGHNIWKKTIGIVGFGRIGRAMAHRARGFHMKILYTKRSRLSPEEEHGLGVEYRDIDTLLRESDFVTLHTPLTKDTFHLINESRLRLMKPHAILINTSRGAIVDEQALIKALKEDWIAGAGLDVFEKEPLPHSSSLLELPTITFVPHIGSATQETRFEMGEVAARNILSVFRGEEPPYWLNPEVARIRPLSRIRVL